MFKSFLGGVHPNDGKSYSMDKAIETPPIPAEVVIPMSQHIGAPCIPIVKVGDHVKKGQLIGTTDAFMHSPIHASTSGDVIKIEERAHVSRLKCLAVVIKSDGLDEWAEGLPMKRNWEEMEKKDILNAIKQGGVVGMGGATFPAHIKLAPNKPIDVLIINAAECEPYLTADYRAMIEYSARIVEGIEILMKVLGVEKCYIGIEDNKPKAIQIMKEAVSGRAVASTTISGDDYYSTTVHRDKGNSIEIAALQTKYPQGAEKMLIKVVTGREVPTGGLPMDVGAVVHNVGTVIAVDDAVVFGIPLIERVTSVTGDAVKEPKNLLLRVGASFKEVIEFCGGFKVKPGKLISGGPMMGMAIADVNVPITKGTSGILILSQKAAEVGEESPCIRCGRCVKACPMGLIPSMLSIMGERRDYRKAKESYGLFNCIECGSCVYTCPAKRNIVQYIKYCKAQNLAEQAREKAKAEAAKAKAAVLKEAAAQEAAAEKK
jgi:electron transport complex protein RnfC